MLAGELEGVLSTQRHRKTKMDTWGDYAGELQVAFDDGSSLTVRHPVTRDITYRDTPTEATIHVAFSALRWEWNFAAQTETVLWLVNMTGPRPEAGIGTANFDVQYVDGDEFVSGRSSWQGNLRGTAHAFLLDRRISKSVTAWCIAISEPVDIDSWLKNDLLALRTVLGRQLESPELHGLAGDGRVVRIVGREASSRRDLWGRQREGLPLKTLDADWERFYSCLCTSTGVAVELREPVAMYVDSVGDSAQGEYLKLRTALVLLCRAVLPEYLQLINAKLLLTALKASDEDSQLDLAVRWATRQDAALVEHVLGQHAPDLVAAVDRVLASTPADHVDLSHRTLESFVEDLAICRTLFFALLGSVIGYNGPIWHWQRANDGQSMMYVLGQRSDSKPSVFNVTATLPAEDLAFQAWPTFEAPSLPNHPVLRALDSFAAALEQRAGGAVRASLQAQPADEDGNRYNFKILLVRSPNIQATVFSVIERDGGMFIEGWRENDDSLRVDDTRVLNEFMNNAANSSTMRRLVMTYMALDSELSRGER